MKCILQFVSTCLLAVLFAAGSQAEAGECGYDYCWGALAVGPYGAAGRATGMRTAPGAAARALETCGANCEAPEVFVNSCAAFAESSKGERAFGWQDTRALAETAATKACEKDGEACRIRIWACSK